MRFRLFRRFRWPWGPERRADSAAMMAVDPPGQAPTTAGRPDREPTAGAETRSPVISPATAGTGQPDRPTQATVPPVIVPRWIQLVMLPLFLLALWALARAAG